MLAVLVQVSGLVFPAIASYTAVYVTMGALVLALGLWPLPENRWKPAPPVLMVFLAVGLVALTLPFVWSGPDDLMGVGIIAPVLLAAGLPLLARHEPRLFSVNMVAGLCLVGTIGALVMGLHDVLVLGAVRAGAGNNPIHYAGLAIILGFMSLIGLFGSRAPLRFVYLTGPLLAVGAALLSGSRGPLLAAALLGVVVLPLLVAWLWRERGFQITVILAAVLLVAGGGYIANQGHAQRALDAFSDIKGFLAGDAVDRSMEKRVLMYRGAVGAFLDSPVVGHGFSNMVPATHKYQPADDIQKVPHLHADIANFAVLGGSLGLVAYLLLLAAPGLALFGARAPAHQRALIVGSLVVGAGYLGIGLTNAVFGVLPQTVLYAVLLGNVVAISHATTADDAAG